MQAEAGRVSIGRSRSFKLYTNVCVLFGWVSMDFGLTTINQVKN